ncbi:MAG: UDP-N-acetylmuramate dehydrogenase [Alphaproteobacteria bacterium]|nr:UDP-N-acetylmuramate dehydrogenase [Alphaproteobacteria bacterium]
MAASRREARLIDRLPAVRGRLSENASLAEVTWFRVGGPAECLFRPADVDDLAQFLAALPADIPVTMLGVGSNLLVRDGGVPGVTIRLGRSFTALAVEGEALRAGAAALDRNVALVALESSLAGLEFMVGIPGTVGGALRMNAGAYGREIKDVLVEAEAVDRKGHRHRVPAVHLGLSYRHAAAPEDWIFTEALFRAERGDSEAIRRRMDEIRAKRDDSQPVRSRTGGSTFANPPGHKAWELIDAAGCRGLARGGAKVSELHCNFLINTGEATAADLEALGEEARRRVFEKFGVRLDWEIRIVGVHAQPTPRGANGGGT